MTDEVVVLHCRYSGTIYVRRHKRCNRTIIEVIARTTNIYAHNASFESKFLLKVVNIALLVGKVDKFPEMKLVGKNAEKVKMMTVRQCCIKDSYAVFESWLDELCKINSEKEKKNVDTMLYNFLINHPHFHTVLRLVEEHSKL